MSGTAEPAPPAREGLLDQLKGLDDRFWIVNIMEMFERLAYYGVRAVVAIYMVLAIELGGPEFDHVQKGAIFAAWAAVQSVLPMFTGGFADRYGHKRTISLAIVIKVIGYGMMASFKSYPLFFAGCMFLAAGTAIFKPGVQGTLAATLKKSSASVGWGIFYQLVNIGGFLGPVLAGLLRILDWSYVFWACALIVSVNFLWLPFYSDPTQEMGDDDLAAKERKLKEGWGLVSRAVPVHLAQGWATALSLTVALWFGLQLMGAALLADAGALALGLGGLGVLGGLAAAASAWRGKAATAGGAVMALLLVVLAAVGATGLGDDTLAALQVSQPGLSSFCDTLGYLAWTGTLIAPALLFFAGDKAAFDQGRTDPFGIYVASVAGLFQHRVLFFCLVFSGFWLMFNQVFDLLPNVIDDWVDSSGIILALGEALSTSATVVLVALVLGLVYGAVCGAGVFLALRPDRRAPEAVTAPATVVAALAVAGALWTLVAPLLGSVLPASALAGLTDLAASADMEGPGALLGAVALPVSLLLGLVVAFGARAARVPARVLGPAAAGIGALGTSLGARGALTDAAPELVAMAQAGAQVNPEWMINLNPGLIVFTMLFFAWLSSFVRPLTSIIIGMAVATVGSIVAGTAVIGWICLGGILIFSVGEMLSSPKKMEYLATLAPRGQEGLFMGYANIPVAIGWISGSIFAGNRYEESGDKVNLARRHMVERLEMDPAAVEALPKTEVMPTLADQLGMSLTEAQHLLYETWHPEQLWTDIGVIGLVSIVGMIVYDRAIKHFDAKKAAEAA